MRCGAAEGGEDADRFVELVGCGVTEREIEVCRKFIGDTALGGDEMRDCIAKVALAR